MSDKTVEAWVDAKCYEKWDDNKTDWQHLAYDDTKGAGAHPMCTYREALIEAVETIKQAHDRPGLAWCKEHCSCVTYIDAVLKEFLNKGE